MSSSLDEVIFSMATDSFSRSEVYILVPAFGNTKSVIETSWFLINPPRDCSDDVGESRFNWERWQIILPLFQPGKVNAVEDMLSFRNA